MPAKIINRVLYGVDVPIFDHSGRLLMLRRDVEDEDFETGWEFVKGGLEVDESYLEGAIREVAEEAGDCLELELLGEIDRDFKVDARYRKRPNYDFVFKRAVVFVCRSGSITLDRNEHVEYQWMDFNEATAKIWVEYGVEILNEAKKYFDAWKVNKYN